MVRGVSVDPITLSVVAGVLENTIKEMATVVTHTARSVTTTLGRDFSNTLFGMLDGVPTMVCQGEDIPAHLGVLMHKVKVGAAHFGPDINPGDVMIHNDPPTGGNHLPDYSIYKPIFLDGELFAWSAGTVHLTETGGPVPGGYNPDADSLFGEGLRVPHVKLVDGGRTRQDIWDFILCNVRTPLDYRGDLDAMLIALNTAERRLLGLCEKYSAETVRECLRQLVDRAEAAARDQIREMPDGVYEGRSIMEGEGTGFDDLEGRCTVRIEGDEMHVQLHSPPQAKNFLNSYENNTLSAVYFAFLSSLAPGIPINEGLYRPLHVDLGPRGTLFNAAEPAPCGTSTGTTFALAFDAVADALAQVNPTRAGGAWSYPNTNIFSGVDPRDGVPFTYLSHVSTLGGGGAYWGVDGGPIWGAITNAGSASTGDVELLEFKVPIHIHRHELRTDSACPGKWRGGLGSVLDIEVQCEESVVSLTGGGSRFAPASRLGADSGYDTRLRLNRKWVLHPSGVTEEFPIRTVRKLERGDRVVGRLTGGGGVGPAWERDPLAVEADVRNGFVSLEKAREEYGVAINPITLRVDPGATQSLRSAG